MLPTTTLVPVPANASHTRPLSLPCLRTQREGGAGGGGGVGEGGERERRGRVCYNGCKKIALGKRPCVEIKAGSKIELTTYPLGEKCFLTDCELTERQVAIKWYRAVGPLRTSRRRMIYSGQALQRQPLQNTRGVE